MASKGAGSVPANITKLDQISPYAKPSESVTVKYEREPNTGDERKKEKKCMRKSRQKGSSGEINAENLEGHKNFDNIEDILAFINGNELENGNEIEKDNGKRETENSLGAIKKTFSSKDKYSSTNARKAKKDEKEKPVMSLPVEQFSMGFFKNHDSVGQSIKIREDREKPIDLKPIVSNNEEDLEIASTNSDFIQIETTCAKLNKFCDQIERKEIFGSEWSSNFIDMYDSVTETVDFEIRLTLNEKLEMIHSTLNNVTYIENNIKSALNLNINKSVPLKILGEAKKGLKVLEKQTKLKQEVFQLTRKEIEINTKHMELNTEGMSLKEELIKNATLVLDEGLNVEFDLKELNQDLKEMKTKQMQLNEKQMSLTEELMNNVTLDHDLKDNLATEKSNKDGENMSSSTLLNLNLAKKFNNLEEEFLNLEKVLNKNKNELAIHKKQIEELEDEKRVQNKVLKEALKKVKELEAKNEYPKNDVLSIGNKPTKLCKEDAKTQTLRDPPNFPRESTYELTFHKTALTTFKTLGKGDVSSTLNNCELVVAATNWNILEWGINEPHPDCHKKLDEENQKRRCSKDICKKCNHDMKGCGLYLCTCDLCELVTKAIAYHEEYFRIFEIVEQGGGGKQIKRRAEVLAKDAMRSFQNVLIPFLMNFIKEVPNYFLEHQGIKVEESGAAKLKDVWEILLYYVKFPLQRIKIDQDYLDVLHQQADNLKEANLEYEDVLDDVRSYVSSRKQLVELWDSNVTPNYSNDIQEIEKGLDSMTKCADDFENIAIEVFTVINTAANASKSGLKVEVVDLKCVEAFLCSALNFTNSAKSSVSKKIPRKLMQNMHWAKELITKIHCVQCRKVILVPGENLVHLEKCSKCKAVRYCNTTCQQLHWDDHKDKCEQFKKMEKKRKREESRAGEKLIRKKEKFWEQVLKPLLCRPGVTLASLELTVCMS